MSVFEWEPLGANGKRGEFLTGFDRREPVFVEVKKSRLGGRDREGRWTYKAFERAWQRERGYRN